SSTSSSTSNPQQPPPPKELYNATIVFNRQAGAGSPTASTTSVVTQLTTDVIQRINQGLMTIVKITTDLPLLKGDQLIMNTSPHNVSGTAPTTTPPTTSTLAATPHLELQQLHSIPSTQRIQQTIINLVRLLVPTQNSYSPLLNNLLSLVSSKPELLKQLPPNIQQAIKQISQHLPNTESLRTADTVKQAIKHSGVLFESSLKAGTLRTDSLTSKPLKSTLLSPELVKSESLKHQHLESQQKKHPSPASTNISASSKPNASVTIGTASATPGITTNTTTRTNTTLQQPSQKNTPHPAPLDFKHQLLSLEKALLSATKTTSTAPQASPAATKPTLGTGIISDPSKIIQKTAISTNSATGTTPTIPTSTTGTPPGYIAPSEKQQLQNIMQLAKAQQQITTNTKNQPNNVKNTTEHPINLATSPTSNTSAPPKPIAIQTYQSASSPSTASLQGIPPLPGQYLMQAQTNTKATLKGNDVADALVKILLKQTQESISRLQLHQLSTAAAHADDGAQVTQAPLSFDLPILHFGQLTLFHFHIEEEPQKNEAEEKTPADRKWNVSMGFDIEGLGAMFCELSLINTYVYVKFWAKEKDTVSRAKNYFDILQKNLHHIGATVKELECIEGLPPQQECSIKPSLIDIET
ncbi:MAG: hypothetical protein KUG73_00155, partial [Pseudomonadales bacterium]|nr:hypothetical protein [Pseudomonadales bacterium]